MSDEKKKILMFLRSLSEKGQGIVEFGVVVAFCVAIGYFMQTVGFASALNDIFGTAASAEFAPADIVAGETKVEGNIAAVDSIGGGTNTGSGGSGSGSGGSGSGSGDSGSSSGESDAGSGTSGSGSGDSGSGGGDSGSGSGDSGSGGQGNEGGNSGGGNTGLPVGGQTGGNDIVSLASTPAGAMTILQKYADYAKNHNLQQWQAVDPAWEAYQADGSPLGITSKDRFGALFIWNWQPADSNWTSWNDVSSSWQWSEIRTYYEAWKNSNS